MLTRTLDVIQRGMSAGLHCGAQLCILYDGQGLADVAVGEAQPGIAMTTDTLMIWRSAGKPLTAVALLQLVEAGRLELDAPVADVIPEFAARGKDRITPRHLLTHTAGLRWVDLRGAEDDWDQTIARICAMRPEPNWAPGEKLGYSPLIAWFILGEIIQRITGRPVAEIVRDRVIRPLAVEALMALEPKDYSTFAPRLGAMMDTSKTPPAASEEHLTTHRIAPSPGLTLHGPMHALAAFYEMLRQHGTYRGATLLKPETVAEMTRRQFSGRLDQTFKASVDMGLGLLLNTPGMADFAYGYGSGATLNTFGHGGSQSSSAFCDPKQKLVVAVVFNGLCGPQRHAQRMREFFAALWTDLKEPRPQ